MSVYDDILTCDENMCEKIFGVNAVVYLLCLRCVQAPAGEAQPSTEVDLFVSTEKIMILNTDLQVCFLVLHRLSNILQDSFLFMTLRHLGDMLHCVCVRNSF